MLQLRCTIIHIVQISNIKLCSALKHSILQDAESVCIFTKDPQKEYKEKFAAIGLSHVKVIGISKLREKHKPYEAKRLLCASYETFLADARILPLLPKLLGKSFYAKKKVPGVVDLRKSGDALAQEIQSALMCTSFYMANGACTSTKVGKVEEMTQDQIVENVMAALPQIIKKVPRGWSNIKSIHIKTTSSVALPIYLNADYKEVVPEVKVYEDSTTEVSPEEMTKRADVSFMKRIMQRIGLKV